MTSYHDSLKLSQWMKERGLQCIKYEDPNRVYCSNDPRTDDHLTHLLYIETDGKADCQSVNKTRIEDATYVVTRSHYTDGAYSCNPKGVLYTLEKDVVSLPVKTR